MLYLQKIETEGISQSFQYLPWLYHFDYTSQEGYIMLSIPINLHRYFIIIIPCITVAGLYRAPYSHINRKMQNLIMIAEIERVIKEGEKRKAVFLVSTDTTGEVLKSSICWNQKYSLPLFPLLYYPFNLIWVNYLMRLLHISIKVSDGEYWKGYKQFDREISPLWLSDY